MESRKVLPGPGVWRGDKERLVKGYRLPDITQVRSEGAVQNMVTAVDNYCIV